MDTWRHWVCIACLWLVGCGAPVQEQVPAQPVVIATFSVLADMTARVGAGVLDVHTLVPADGDTHMYEPTPADSVALAKAAVVVQLGLGLEPWFADMYAAAQSNAPVIIASTPVKVHVHAGESDPHVWHDVQRSIQMVTYLGAELAKQFPVFAQRINTNTQAYVSELTALDGEIVAQVATLPQAKRLLVTNHDTFGYFAERYGFTILGTALGTTSTEGSDPGAAAIAALSDQIRAAHVPAIFVENIANTKLITQIAAAAGVRVAPALYTDALGGADTPGAHYVEMMRYNVRTIVQALSETAP